MSAIGLNGAFRIYAPRQGVTPSVAATVAAPPPQDPYFARLVKLVPSEVLAFYVAFKDAAAPWIGWWSLVCLVLVVFVRTIGTKQAGGKPQFASVIIAAISFVLWIYATGGHILSWILKDEAHAVVSIAIGLWTFLLPYLYKGDS
jgi:hypothetical protein